MENTTGTEGITVWISDRVSVAFPARITESNAQSLEKFLLGFRDESLKLFLETFLQIVPIEEKSLKEFVKKYLHVFPNHRTIF